VTREEHLPLRFDLAADAVLVHLESFIISSEMRHEHNMICPIPAVADRTSPGAVMRNTQPQLRPYDPSFRTLLPAQDDKETSRHDPIMEEEKRAGTIQSWKRRKLPTAGPRLAAYTHAGHAYISCRACKAVKASAVLSTRKAFAHG
jgi:hypothetical protein